MTPDPRKIAISEHQRWMGYLQPDGLVVSPLALVDAQVQLDTGSYTVTQERFLDALTPDPTSGSLGIPSFAFFARNFLGWRDELLSIFSVSAEIPGGLKISTGEHGEILQPDAAYKFFQPADPARPYLLLIRQLPPGTLLDQIPDAKQEKGWVATPHQKFERLLRETGVHVGVLCNGSHIRLTHAPKGENSGSLTFPVAFMTETAGRILPAVLDLLLSHRRLNSVPEPLRLPALLRKSRDYQAHVSTALSHQVLEALFELTRGFQTADEKAKGTLLNEVWQKDPQQIYGGLITTLLRLVFLLYAEDRGLMPGSELYQRGYSVQGLFDQLRTDAERFPDHMDDRFAAWPRLLALFRAVHGGCRHREMPLPARQGHLFDPDRFPFLEGRLSSNQQSTIPLLADGTLHRVLHLLLYLDGERLSYRTLDVEQIGSVYETIMGFAVEKAPGKMIALKPKKAHGAPVHVSLEALLGAKPTEREKILFEQADTKLPDAASKALKSAAAEVDFLAALEKRIDRRATPYPVPAGSIILQPTDERRRSGSHYTPRSFTEPIVRKTLEPILDRLGRHPLPQEILDLKIADIAVGSAAFLVETCRQLAKELCSSWLFHDCRPVIPPDEDEDRHAMRLVAQRSLYGVDRNPMAVDLAKLSLWLATMARDHPFTFLDHAIKCGDSLVGLTNKQIAAFHWDPTQAAQRVMGEDQMESLIEAVVAKRREIIADPEDTEYAILRKQARLAEADSAAQKIKTTGDLAIAAFFAGSKPKERQQLRDDFLERHLALQRGQNVQENLAWQTRTLHQLRSGEHPIRPFHWEIEFPEVFSRENPGFDGFVGNPPFVGGRRVRGALGDIYYDWLQEVHLESSGNADLVAHFYRRSFNYLRSGGCSGLIATNTIGQGDTRATGLRWICSNGGTIYAAQKRQRWPGEAAVVVSVVWITNGSFPGSFLLDGREVEVITAYLFHAGGHENPANLGENAGKSFIGCYVLGMGFTFDDSDSKGIAASLEEMEQIVSSDPRNSERIFPYIGGEELNESPTQEHRRYAISFADYPLRRDDSLKPLWNRADEKQRAKWLRDGIVPRDYPEPVAADWKDLLNVVEQRVKPERTRTKPNGQFVLRDPLPRRWWQYADKRPALTSALQTTFRALVLSRVGQQAAFTFMPSGVVFSDSLVVFPLHQQSAFSIMQGRAHETWARFMASSMKDDLRYIPTDCFETFPFPEDWEENAALEEAGKAYYEFRAELMVRNDEGLTKTYNRFHDPDERSSDILRLRELHAAMDRAVLDAYGWTGIPTDCQFLLDYEEDDEGGTEITGTKRKKKKPWRYRWPDDIRDEVLARLLALNAERHDEEFRLGMKFAKKTVAKKVARKIAVSRPGDDSQIELFPTSLAAAPNAPADPWRERIAAFRFDLPDTPRPADANSLGYYRILIPALIQEAGGRILWNVLHTAVALLSDKELLLSIIDGEAGKSAKLWARKSRLPTNPDVFASGIEEAILTSRKVKLTGIAPVFELRLSPDVQINRAPWHVLDARLALAAAVAAIERGTSVHVSDELNKKIIQFALSA